MRIALLITNTDFSAFSKARPDDAEKFTTLLTTARPDWACDAFWVCKDDFPEDIAGFDGVLITGSPASVNENTPWMQRLEGLIREIIFVRQPLFGACFGHQAIAKALGSEVVRSAHGWNHGLLDLERVERTPWSSDRERFALYGSHIEQVAKLPNGAVRVFETPNCPIAGFTYLDCVFTVQHHPEMSHAFITDLVNEYADYVGEDVTQAALASLERQADGAAFAEEMALFFEYAAALRNGGAA